MERTEVFIDISNAHLIGHDLYARNLDPLVTRLNPRAIAEQIVALQPEESELLRVHVFQCEPDHQADPEEAAAMGAEVQHWSQEPKVRVHTAPRHLGKYTRAPKYARMDIWIRLNLTVAAIDGEADRLVLFSSDSDLYSAVEGNRLSRTPLELVAWDVDRLHPGNELAKLCREGCLVRTRRLDETDFWASQDIHVAS